MNDEQDTNEANAVGNNTVGEPPAEPAPLAPTSGSPLLPATLGIPLSALFVRAGSSEDRILLIRLAKEHLIHAQEFEEAMKLRTIERDLLRRLNDAVMHLGRNALENTEVSQREADVETSQ
jgi:hypothetical protein